MRTASTPNLRQLNQPIRTKRWSHCSSPPRHPHNVLRHTFVNEYCSDRCAPTDTEVIEIDKFAVFGELGGTNPGVRFFVFGDVEGRSAGGVQVLLAA